MIQFSAVKDRIITTKEDYQTLLVQFPALLQNLKEMTLLNSSIEQIHKLFGHPEFSLLPIFFDIDFVNSLVFLLNYNTKTGVLAAEVIGNIWYYLEDFGNIFTSKKFVQAVYQCCSQFNQPELIPPAFFAIANFCAISVEARDLFLENNAHRTAAADIGASRN